MRNVPVRRTWRKIYERFATMQYELVSRVAVPRWETSGALRREPYASSPILSTLHFHISRFPLRFGGGSRRQIQHNRERILARHGFAAALVAVVDDDDHVRESVREMLTALGHSVIEAGSLAEARGLVDLPGLSLILSDLQLGDGRGAALAGAGLPLVLMTALPPGHAGRAGLDGPVLTKPFLAAELAAQIERLPFDD